MPKTKEEEREAKISRLAKVLGKKLSKGNAKELAVQLYSGAEDGGEFKIGFQQWLERRFEPQLVWLSREDYVRALTRALWLAPRFAGADFGSSRQRDFGQVWTDTARGFLGEIALGRFLKEQFAHEVHFDSARGKTEDYLPTDIAMVREGPGEIRPPKLNVSVKATKFNGRWMDVPGAQITHSDVFVLVKIGVTRTHLLSFMKAQSFLKDKLLPEAVKIGELTEEEASRLWKETPVFEEMPAYIAGFVEKDGLKLPIHALDVRLSRGPVNTKLVVEGALGMISVATLREHSEVRRLDPEARLPIDIAPIIKSLSGSAQHFFANSGVLNYGKEEWPEFVKKI